MGRFQPGAGEKRDAETGPSPVDRGWLGSKHHLIVDQTGIPLAFSLTGGNRHDVTQLIPLVDRVSSACGIVGRSRRRPDRLCGDRGYDYQSHRRKLRQRGIKPVIARGEEPRLTLRRLECDKRLRDLADFPGRRNTCRIGRGGAHRWLPINHALDATPADREAGSGRMTSFATKRLGRRDRVRAHRRLRGRRVRRIVLVAGCAFVLVAAPSAAVGSLPGRTLPSRPTRGIAVVRLGSSYSPQQNYNRYGYVIVGVGDAAAAGALHAGLREGQS